ncbi:MAG: glycoside hydrolase family 3 N-terminal domain-containing protein, partial [Candidatus Limnocylindrales bacterium]
MVRISRGRLRAGLSAFAVLAIVPGAVGLVADQPANAATDPVTRVFNSMNDGQRVGQLFMASLNSSSPITAVDGLIIRNHVGSVILQGHWTSAAQVSRATSHLRALTTQGNTARIRPYLAGDQEGGLIQPYKGSGFSTIPSAFEQGRHTPSWLQSNATIWGRQLKAAGINLNLAPVADTVPASMQNTNAPIGALDRNFGNTTQGVSSHVTAFMHGM